MTTPEDAKRELVELAELAAEDPRPWRAAWLVFAEVAGCCWCGAAREGTAVACGSKAACAIADAIEGGVWRDG